MRKKRYYIEKFPILSKKHYIATLSGNILGKFDRIFQSFQTYADESYGHTPRRILHNMTKNNENIFGPKLPEIYPFGDILNERQSIQESSRQLKESSFSSSFSRRKLKFDDEMKMDLDPIIAETETAAIINKVDIHFHVNAEKLSSLFEDDKMDVVEIENAEKDINLEEREIGLEKYTENVSYLTKRNSERSVSVITKLEDIEVEIDIDLFCALDEALRENTEQDSGPSEIINITKRTKLPYICPSKSIKTTDHQSVFRDSHLDVVYDDPTTLKYLVRRLSLILFYRKTCMERIHNCFENFSNGVREFLSTIGILKNVVSVHSFSKNGHKKVREDLITNADKLLEKAGSLLEDVKLDIHIWEKCLHFIDIFEKEKGPLLSARGESVLTIKDIKRLELDLKEICKEADGTLVLTDGRREILLNLSCDFESLIMHFVRFLIITGILVSL